MHHRGTYERPGLVLGLAPGGSTRGVAYRVAAADWAGTFAYLREREQPTETYVEAWRSVRIDGGDTHRSSREMNGACPRESALVFLSDPHHPQWAGALTLERQAELIDGATGLSGRNIDYLRDLVAHLREEGVHDRCMERLLLMVEAREAGATRPASTSGSGKARPRRSP